MGRFYFPKDEDFKRKYQGVDEMNINKVQLLGRVGGEIEMKDINGNEVAEFSFATSRKWKSKTGEQKETTAWHNIQVWGNSAKVVKQYSAKGKRLFLEGEIVYQTWDKKDGTKGYKTIINANNVVIIDFVEKNDIQAHPEFTHEEIPF